VGWLRRFGRFWYDFLVGDDWLAAVGVGAAPGVERRRAIRRPLSAVRPIARADGE